MGGEQLELGSEPPEPQLGRTRARLERRAERRLEWAEGRAAKSGAALERVHAIADGIPFGQPILVGHHSERHARRDQARMEQGMAAAVEHDRAASNHASKADGLERQLAGSIYSDDVDAVERLEERIGELEAERDRVKAYNASCRAGRRDVELLDKAQRANLEGIARACPYQLGTNGALPGYALANLGADIRRNRERLERIKGDRATVAAGGHGRGRQMLARFGSECVTCGQPIGRGDVIVYYRLTREAVHDRCSDAAAK
jgi:uncharacterized small protein (DUF1192 family)